MDQRARNGDPPLKQLLTEKFGSLSLAQTYIDTVHESIGSLSGGELIDALERLDDAYNEFPELELDRPRGELLEGLRSAAKSMPDRVRAGSAEPSIPRSERADIARSVVGDGRAPKAHIVRSAAQSIS